MTSQASGIFGLLYCEMSIISAVPSEISFLQILQWLGQKFQQDWKEVEVDVSECGGRSFG